jgi:hypothetical protein
MELTPKQMVRYKDAFGTRATRKAVKATALSLFSNALKPKRDEDDDLSYDDEPAKKKKFTLKLKRHAR